MIEQEDRRVVNPKTGRMVDPMSPNQARKDGRGARYDALRHEITDQTCVTDCIDWGIKNKPEIDGMPELWRNDLREELSDHMTTLRRLAAQENGADEETGEIEPKEVVREMLADSLVKHERHEHGLVE